MSELSIGCEYCVDQQPFITSTVPESISVMDWRKAWKRHATSFKLMTCPSCGAGFQLADDGVAAEDGGLVARMNVSAPKIDSINIATGPRTGGNVAYITGAALDIGSTLVVKFGGKAATVVDQRTATTARVVVPPATYTLNVVAPSTLLVVTPISGTFQANEAFTSPAGSTGTIWKAEGNKHWVQINYRAPEDVGLVGMGMTGGTSGAIGTVASLTTTMFLPGENIIGLTSAAQGVIRTRNPLVVDAPSNGFAPSEYVRGTASNTLAKLTTSPAYSGLVDITVENEYGQRKTGGALLGAYTYA